MKIVCIDDNDIFIMPDTVVFHSDDPFFAPDFGFSVDKVQGVVIKINRMVKCIDAKFAPRVWSEAAHCIDYRLTGLDSVTISRSFDRSFCLTSDWSAKTEMKSAQIEKFDKMIQYASNFVTLRVGDYIFMSND